MYIGSIYFYLDENCFRFDKKSFNFYLLDMESLDKEIETPDEEEEMITTDLPMLTIPDDEKEASTMIPDDIKMIPDDIIDEVIDTTMKPTMDKEDKPDMEDVEEEIETTMMPMIDDDMVSDFQSICVQLILAHPHALRTIAFPFAHSHTALVC